jgi:Ferritin-like
MRALIAVTDLASALQAIEVIVDQGEGARGDRMRSHFGTFVAAAWSLVHGLATLWLNGNLPEQLGSDPEEITRTVARYLSLPETITAAAEAD